jgi:hypothetical protein
MYRDPVIELLKSVLNAHGPAALQNKYFTGDPLVVAKSRLPAVFITRDVTRITNEDVVNDRHDMAIVLNVVQDLTADFNQAFDQLNSSVTLYRWIEGRNADYTLRSDSLLYILRNYQETIANNMWINMAEAVEASYGVTVNKRGNGIYSVEAVIHVLITALQMSPNDSYNAMETEAGNILETESGVILDV